MEEEDPPHSCSLPGEIAHFASYYKDQLAQGYTSAEADRHTVRH